MGNGQSSGEIAAPEPGLRLSTVCQYCADSGVEEERESFSWFSNTRDTSGLLLKGAHRWGYLKSRGSWKHLFQDSKWRFFVLLDQYLCYFDSHIPDSRMRGSLALDKEACHLELLPQPADGDEEQLLEIRRTADDWSMVLSFTSALELQVWMKTIFDIQQRAATFTQVKEQPPWAVDSNSSCGATRDRRSSTETSSGSMVMGSTRATGTMGGGNLISPPPHGAVPALSQRRGRRARVRLCSMSLGGISGPDRKLTGVKLTARPTS
ncbi:unnamed protein product, partial [Discosporangium mesarthrocarpum]